MLLYAPGRIVDQLDDDWSSAGRRRGPRTSRCARGSGQVLTGTIAAPLCSDVDLARGGIGDIGNFLEIDVDTAGGGVGVLRAFDTTATGNYGIYLSEVLETGGTAGTGNLRLYEVRTLGNVALNTEDGSVVDARHTTPGLADDAEIYANTIDIDANGGSIGSTRQRPRDRLRPAARRRRATSRSRRRTSIYLTEVDSFLRLVLAQALHRQHPPDGPREHAGPRRGPLPARAAATRCFYENAPDSPRNVPGGRIRAPLGSITLQIGDDVDLDVNSKIVAGHDIDIYGDWTDLDAHFGTTMLLRGEITAGCIVSGTGCDRFGAGAGTTYTTEIWGDTDVDTFLLGHKPTLTEPADEELVLGSKTRIRGSQDLSRRRGGRRGPLRRLAPAVDEHRGRPHAHARRPGRVGLLHRLHDRQPRLDAELRDQRPRHRRRVRRRRRARDLRPRHDLRDGAGSPARSRGRRHLPAPRGDCIDVGAASCTAGAETADRPAYVALPRREQRRAGQQRADLRRRQRPRLLPRPDPEQRAERVGPADQLRHRAQRPPDRLRPRRQRRLLHRRHQRDHDARRRRRRRQLPDRPDLRQQARRRSRAASRRRTSSRC